MQHQKWIMDKYDVIMVLCATMLKRGLSGIACCQDELLWL